MQPLHDNDQAGILLVIQPAIEGMVEPIIDSIALRFRECLIRLKWIVDDDQVCTSAGQHTADRGGQTTTIMGSLKFLHRLLLRRESSGKQTSVPLTGHYSSAVHGMFIGQVLAVAGADDLGTGVMTQNISRESDRGRVRLQRTRRHINNQTWPFASEACLQLRRDEFVMPVMGERKTGIELKKSAVHECVEVIPTKCLIFSRTDRRHCPPPGVLVLAGPLPGSAS